MSLRRLCGRQDSIAIYPLCIFTLFCCIKCFQHLFSVCHHWSALLSCCAAIVLCPGWQLIGCHFVNVLLSLALLIKLSCEGELIALACEWRSGSLQHACVGVCVCSGLHASRACRLACLYCCIYPGVRGWLSHPAALCVVCGRGGCCTAHSSADFSAVALARCLTRRQ